MHAFHRHLRVPFRRILLAAAPFIGLFAAGAADNVPSGVPEPGLIVWGAVVNQTNTSQAVHIQSAEWTVTDGVKTALFSGNTHPAVRIVQRDGQSYYVLDVPFDTRRLGAVTLNDPAVVGLDSFELKASSPPTYVLTPTINGVLATVRSVNGAPSSGDSVPVSGFSSFFRGRVIRVDLAIIPVLQDYDSWAGDQFGDPNAPEAARGFDADQDGMTNEEEFRAGTDPNDPESQLRVLTLSFDASGTSATLGWSSVAQKQYVIQAATNVEGPWIDVGTPIAGSGAVTEAAIALQSSDPNSFFRIQILE